MKIRILDLRKVLRIWSTVFYIEYRGDKRIIAAVNCLHIIILLLSMYDDERRKNIFELSDPKRVKTKVGKDIVRPAITIRVYYKEKKHPVHGVVHIYISNTQTDIGRLIELCSHQQQQQQQYIIQKRRTIIYNAHNDNNNVFDRTGRREEYDEDERGMRRSGE